MTKKQLAEREHLREYLRGRLKPGDTLYFICRNWSGRTLTRRFDVYYLTGGEMCRITGSVAGAVGYTYSDRHETLVCQDDACGIAHGLATALFCPDKYDHDKAFCLNYRQL